MHMLLGQSTIFYLTQFLKQIEALLQERLFKN